MRKRRWTAMIILAVGLCFWAGCGEEKSVTLPGVPTGETYKPFEGAAEQSNPATSLTQTDPVFWFGGYSLQKEGAICYWDSILKVIDYETGISMPLCIQANCEHEPASSLNPHPSCYAAYEGMVLCAFVYQEKMYVVETPDMLHTVIYVSEKTGEGRKKIAEGDFVMSDYRSFFSDGKLYFEADEYALDNYSVEKQGSYLCAFDVKHADFMRITETTKEQLYLENVIGERVFYTKIKHNPELLQNGGTDDLVSYQCMMFDGTNGQTKEVLKADGIREFYATADGYYYRKLDNNEYQLFYVNLQGEEQFLKSMNQGSDFKILSGKPFYSDECFGLQKSLDVVAEFDSYYMIQDIRRQDENGCIINGIGFIRKEDFWNKTDRVVYIE